MIDVEAKRTPKAQYGDDISSKGQSCAAPTLIQKCDTLGASYRYAGR